MKFKSYQIHVVAIERDNPISDVPCGDCIQCCVRLSPNLTPEEFESGQYMYTLLSTPGQHTPNVAIPRGERGCFYLDENRKCSIYDRRPLACRQFDCREGHYPPFADLVKEKFNMEMKNESE